MGELCGKGEIDGRMNSERILAMRPEFTAKLSNETRSVMVKKVITDPAVNAGVDYNVAIHTVKSLLLESEINRKIACKQCGKCPEAQNQIIPPITTIGNIRSKIWVVGHSPTECCANINVAFGDGNGILLRSTIDRFFNEQPFYTYIQKCFNYDPITTEECVSNYFIPQITIGKPSWIILIGKPVLQSLLKDNSIDLIHDYSNDCHTIKVIDHQVLVYEIPEFERILIGSGNDYTKAANLFGQTIHNVLQTKLS